MKNFLLPVILFCASLCCTALEIDPAKAVIVAPGSEKLAAGELQKHLKLITGVEIPIQGKADGQFAFTELVSSSLHPVRSRAPNNAVITMLSIFHGLFSVFTIF